MGLNVPGKPEQEPGGFGAPRLQAVPGEKDIPVGGIDDLNGPVAELRRLERLDQLTILADREIDLAAVRG